MCKESLRLMNTPTTLQIRGGGANLLSWGGCDAAASLQTLMHTVQRLLQPGTDEGCSVLAGVCLCGCECVCICVCVCDCTHTYMHIGAHCTEAVAAWESVRKSDDRSNKNTNKIGDYSQVTWCLRC